MLNSLRKHPVAIVFAVVFLFVGWLTFRPELLFVNKTVNDPFPTTAPAVTNSAQQRH